MALQFSVVIPLYNKAPHVEAAVASALAQTLPPSEVIVIDDGSTDGSDELVARIDDPRVKLLRRSPPGPGGYAARNLGIEAARSEWVIFLDADDAWHPNHLQTLADTLAASGPGVDCAFTGVTLVYSDRRRSRRMWAGFDSPGRPLSFATMLRGWLETGECPLWTGACAFRRQTLFDAGLFPAGRALRGGDKDLWLRVMARTRCAYSGQETAEFHQETVNRVSNFTSHSDLPIIVGTIREMIGSAPPDVAALLRRLVNLEIVAYARHSAGRGRPYFSRFARRLYYPVGMSSLAKVAGYFAAGLAIGGVQRFRT